MRLIKNLLLAILLTIPMFAFAQSEQPQLIVKVSNQSVILDNTSMASARMEPNKHGYNLVIVMTPETAKRLTTLTETHIGKTMTLYYGKKFIARSTIRGSLGNQFQIPNFPEQEGKALVESLKQTAS